MKKTIITDITSRDACKATKELQWKPETSFEELIKMMVESDYNELSKK